MLEEEKYDVVVGGVLVADPFLIDPYFNRAVIMLAQFTDEGAMGFVLNQPTDLMIKEVFEDFPDFEARIYLGGPVDRDIIYFVHTKGDEIEDSIQVTTNLWWGGNFEKLKELIREGKINPNEVRFFLGYSGWSSGQLEEELEKDSWISGPLKKSFVLGNGYSKLWSRAIKSTESKRSFYGEFAFSPSLS